LSGRRRRTTQRFARDALLYAAAGALGKGLALFTVPLLSRSLGPAQYGSADLAVAFSFLATLIVSFSGDISAGRLAAMAADATARRSVLASWIAATALVATAAAAALAPLSGAIATVLWDAPDRALLALMAVILIPIAAVQAALTSVLRLEGRAIASAATAIADLVAQLFFGILFVLLGTGPVGLLTGYVIGSSLGLVVAAIAAGRHMRGLVTTTDMIRIVRVGLPFLPAGTLFIGSEYVVRSIVLGVMGDAAVGELAVAIRLANTMLLISAGFSLAWGPFGLAQRFDPKTSRLFGLVFQGFAVGSAVVALSVAAIGPEVVQVVSGSSYLAASQALPGLLLAAAMSGLFYIQAIAAGVQDRTRGVPIAAVAGSLTQIVVTLLAVPALGLLGVGMGALAGRALSLLILGYETRSALRMQLMTAVVIVAAGIGALTLGALSRAPDDTVWYRLAVLVIAVAAGLVAWRWWLRPQVAPLTPE
jgi:O-antigen/teichoic acid export membrane protein